MTYLETLHQRKPWRSKYRARKRPQLALVTSDIAEPIPARRARDFLQVASKDFCLISLKEIMQICAVCYGVDYRDLMADRHFEALVWPRYIAYYFAATMTPFSMMKIAKVYRRDHSTVYYGFNKISAERDSDPAFANELLRIEAIIRSGEMSARVVR